MHPGEPASVAPDATDTTEQQQPRRMPLALATVALVVVVLAVVASLFAVKLTTHQSGSGPPATPLASNGVVNATVGVPEAVLDAVGAPGPPLVDPPTALVGSQDLLRQGRPLVIFVGAEFCPFCAAERWALVEALGHFGTFTHLGATSSAVQLVFPRIASFSFRGATYRSRLVSFEATEMYSSSTSISDPFLPLQAATTTERQLMRRLDVPPLAPTSGALPFVDIGGRAVTVGSQFSPAILVGLPMSTIAGDLSNPSSPVAVDIDGAANDITAAICSLTGGRPAAVCQASAVHAAAGRLAQAVRQ